MQDSEMRDKLEKIIKAYEELQAKMSDPAVLADQKEYNKLAKEYSDQGELVAEVAVSTCRPAPISTRPRRCSATLT